MKKIIFLTGMGLMLTTFTFSQDTKSTYEQEQKIQTLIDIYSQARTKKDSAVLRSILTTDIDQLVSSGNWRKGKKESLEGMLQSSASNPGTRTLKIEKIRFLNSVSAIADARYQIRNADGTIRKMWSTFIVVYAEDKWKITAIRNMLPASPQ
jgi:uncharacterized protein (TIGR02246 family)